MTWEVRAVDQTGTLVSTVAANVDRVSLGINGDESATLSIPTLHVDTNHLDLFGNEIQLWLDGDFYGWFRPTIIDADRSGATDALTVQCEGLFSYFHDVVVGGQLPNHITSPHLDSAAVGAAPAAWTVTSNVEAAAIVDNNATFYDIAKAIQLNNSEAGQDAYAYQRFTVTADLDRVPMFAAAEVYVADNQGGAPAYGGAAYLERGLMIHRLDGTTFEPVSQPQVARITDETPRNQVVRLETPGVMPLTGEVVEVRLYAPAAYTAWRFAWLRDDRALAADRVDKSVAVTSLVDLGQNAAIGWWDYNIGTDVVSLGQAISQSWPWWRRDVIGEQIEDLADTFEFTMDYPTLTPGSAVRNVKVRTTIGTDLTATVTLTKEDFVAWGLGMANSTTANLVIRQGEGSGAARWESWQVDVGALGGPVRARLTFGTPGEGWATLRDTAAEELDRAKGKPRLPRARIVGDLAKTIRPGDTVAVDLDHGWAVYLGGARVMKVELDGTTGVASLDLEPVT